MANNSELCHLANICRPANTNKARSWITSPIIETICEAQVTKRTMQDYKRRAKLGQQLAVKTLHNHGNILLIFNHLITGEKLQFTLGPAQCDKHMPCPPQCDWSLTQAPTSGSRKALCHSPTVQAQSLAHISVNRTASRWEEYYCA